MGEEENKYHSFLQQQLQEAGLLNPNQLPSATQWRAFLARVDSTYLDYDREKHLNKQSIEVSTREMHDLYSKLRSDRDKLQSLTEELQLNEVALKHNTQQLQKSNEYLEQFAFIASHDLKEPLRKIETFASLLVEECGSQLNDDGKEMIARLQQAVQRMRGLIEGLLSFSRISRSKDPLVPVDLNLVLNVVKEDLAVGILEKNATLTIAPDLPVIPGTEAQLHQLFLNLIANAIKFTPEDRLPEVKVYYQLLPESNKVKITVEDNGIGIDPQYHDQIFQIFKRLHGRTRYEGHGIGLALCQEIVTRHAGCIQVESKLDHGTQFHILLPLERKQP